MIISKCTMELSCQSCVAKRNHAVLLASGWMFIKPFLSSKDKRVISIVVPLQVLANIASAIGNEAAVGSTDRSFWVRSQEITWVCQTADVCLLYRIWCYRLLTLQDVVSYYGQYCKLASIWVEGHLLMEKVKQLEDAIMVPILRPIFYYRGRYFEQVQAMVFLLHCHIGVHLRYTYRGSVTTSISTFPICHLAWRSGG